MKVDKSYSFYKILLNPNLDIWQILLYKGEPNESGSCDAVFKEYNYKPSLEEIKKDVMSVLNEKIEEEIISGFKWEDATVWLTVENQSNYFRSFVMCVLTEGATLPITFKIGTDDNPKLVTFNSLEELQPFIVGAFKHIHDTLERGWRTKYQETNWEVYNDDEHNG